jgi:hypothetical protein
LKLIHFGNLGEIKSGWWLTYPSEKYESQLGVLFPAYGKIIHSCSKPPTRLLWLFDIAMEAMAHRNR